MPLSLMIKPASGACNLRCAYCFYCDEMENRGTASYGFMNRETMEVLIRKALQQAEGSCTFGFQGGEPTLWGLEYFQEFVECVKRQKRDDLEIFYFIQTNGYTLDDRWARFFQENRFLVGVSLDGTIHTHDRWRKNIRGEGTFRRVMEGIDSLNRYRVPFNILTVVTGDVARTADKVYRFLRKQGFDHLQFIPCMDPLGGKEKSAYSLSGEEYGDFLCRIFDLWYDELCRGEQVWIRQFDNYVDMLSGYEPEACDMRGRCGKNYVIEADGSVYPCDFYALDQWKIGDIKREGWEEIDRNREKKGFLEEIFLPEECRKCPWAALCRGGCRRYREGEQGKHCFCAAYRKFFETCGERLARLARARL